MTRGWPLFVLVCGLAAAPYAWPSLSFWPVLGLLVLWALTTNASAGRSSGEAASSTGERGD